MKKEGNEQSKSLKQENMQLKDELSRMRLNWISPDEAAKLTNNEKEL